MTRRTRVAARVARWTTAGAAVGFAWVCYGYLTLPDVRPLIKTNPETTAFIELRTREALDEGRKPRRSQRWVTYSRISPHLKRAVLVAEDAAFWDHEGVDYAELRKSTELNLSRWQLVRGASTITQQLAKNLYLTPSRSPMRKFRELIIARRLEAELDKTRIFEIYLNVIEWGDGIYGVGAAAHAYFGASPTALGPSASALLAGAIINPRALNPATPTNRLRSRQRLILGRMGVGPSARTAEVGRAVDAVEIAGAAAEGEIAGGPGADAAESESTGDPDAEDVDDPGSGLPPASGVGTPP